MDEELPAKSGPESATRFSFELDPPPLDKRLRARGRPSTTADRRLRAVSSKSDHVVRVDPSHEAAQLLAGVAPADSAVNGGRLRTVDYTLALAFGGAYPSPDGRGRLDPVGAPVIARGLVGRQFAIDGQSWRWCERRVAARR